MNQGLERMWKAMVLVTGLVMPGRSEEYHKTVRNIQGNVSHDLVYPNGMEKYIKLVQLTANYYVLNVLYKFKLP
jgi:hypothetical protein